MITEFRYAKRRKRPTHGENRRRCANAAGFIFQSSEIYGGLNGFWDYGPLGAELKRNLKELLVATQTSASATTWSASTARSSWNRAVWKASGHVDTFSDPMVDCKTCKGRFRADQLNSLCKEAEQDDCPNAEAANSPSRARST